MTRSYSTVRHVTFQGTYCFEIREGDLVTNQIKNIREELLISKAELARKAGVSPLTINRIENGNRCRVETKRKIILALGYKLSDKDKIFPKG